MVIFHLLQNIFQTDSCVTSRTPKLLHLREQGPIFLMMTRGNLICALVESWEFDPVHINEAPHLWTTFSHLPLMQVWIYVTQSCQIWSY